MSKSTNETTQAKPKLAKAAKTAAPASSARKPDIILKLLNRAKGATIEQLQEATSWQPHSIRAVISGFRKKGVTISRSQSKDGTNVYQAAK